MDKVKVNLHSQCWEWQGYLQRGYGEISINGENIKAHRASYEIFIGKIPDGLVIDHLCRNPRCVNPTHLEPVTLEENTKRGFWPPSVNSRKTHCIRGHELSGENLRINFKKNKCGVYKNSRECKTCVNMWRKVFFQKRREENKGLNPTWEDVRIRVLGF